MNVVGLDGYHVGVLQSVREIPGFLALLVTYVILIIKEHRLSALSIIILGAGVFLTGLLPSFSGLIFTTLVMSSGFHYYETTNKSLTLQYFDRLTSLIVFSAQRRYADAANIGVGILIFFIAPFLSYTAIYVLFGGLISIGGALAFTRRPDKTDIVPQKKQLVFKKRYWLFYFLTFMAGAFFSFISLCLVQFIRTDPILS